MFDNLGLKSDVLSMLEYTVKYNLVMIDQIHQVYFLSSRIFILIIDNDFDHS